MEGTDTHATPPVIANGEKSKARNILAAVRTLQAVEREHRPATEQERQTLARFGGFGAVALSIFPDPVTGRTQDAGWQFLGDELKSLLSPEEYDSAKRTTFTAFYTSSTVIESMHAALSRLGIPSNATVLEPGCGTGNFMAHAPAGQRFIGVELDSISGRIARALHPEADIRIENFRDTKLPPVDAVIGNVPFADVKLNFHGQKLSLHDFFIAKSIDALKPGGVLAVVTSHYTLDKQNAAVREHLASQADFHFKVDGLPWGPIGLAPGSCFIGISFFRPLGERSTLRTSVVQAFDENGEGLVLRGHNFFWDDQKMGKSPHLSEEMAGGLIDMVLDRYQDERKRLPQRVVVHKSSRFEPGERAGFDQALRRVQQYDLVALTPTSEVRLIRAGQYPPLRGTGFSVGTISKAADSVVYGPDSLPGKAESG